MYQSDADLLATRYTKDINMLVPWYLMGSYMYYVEDDPIMSDSVYDSICNRLLEAWDDVEHYHKHLVDKEDLKCGSRLSTEYPNRVKYAALSLKVDKKKQKKR